MMDLLASPRRNRAGDSPVWCEIDLVAYRHNLGQLRSRVDPRTRFMAVVKADGYGHGAVEVARVASGHGVDWLGVARPAEAFELRQAGIETPILVFGEAPVTLVPNLLEYSVTASIYSRVAAEALSTEARRLGKRLRCHLKIDTGMGRLGLLDTGDSRSRWLAEIETICELPGLAIEGIFTHFATADGSDDRFARQQLERFVDLTDELASRGCTFPLRHAANSAALLTLSESHLDMVRPGIATYGIDPGMSKAPHDVDLRPVLRWKTRIIQLKAVPENFGVSYGLTYRTPRPTRLATLPVGYADGFDRRLSSRGEVLIRGERAPIVGRICMDLTMIDVGQIEGVATGDEVVLCGRQGSEQISAAQIAAQIDTIPYEILTRIGQRVPRLHLD